MDKIWLNIDNTLDCAKRLADYVRMEIANKSIAEGSPLHIAYRDFIEEWKKYQNLIKQSDE